MKRLIIQNVDKVPDDIIAGIMALGLPETGAIEYKTRVGAVCVAVVDGRKSRVYQFWRPWSEDVLLDNFTAEE